MDKLDWGERVALRVLLAATFGIGTVFGYALHRAIVS